MEVVGVAASAVTLAALFSSCIECFSYFKAAQNCPSEAESLLVKLDCEKTRLLVWANTVGILQTDHHKRRSELADTTQDRLIRRCIEQIIALLTEARKLRDEYGGRETNEQESQRYLAVLSVNSMSVFQSAKRTFFARVRMKDTMPSLTSRIKWAVRDAAKFRILLLSLREFVDSLIQLVPVPIETINGIVEEDIVSTVDIGSLRLIENGCDKDSYPQWSARASEAIRDSVMGTIDRRNLQEILRDIESAQEDHATTLRPETASRVDYSNLDFDKVFVVLTETCLNVWADSSGDCAESKIGKTALNSACPTSFTRNGSWNLGRRLSSHLKLPFDWQEKLEKDQSIRLRQAELEFELPAVQKFCRIYVYCGACACAINTARMLALSADLPEFVDFVVRIDDRLTTSCHNLESTASVLEAIQDTIEDIDSRDSKHPALRAIDCPALESRIFALEQEQPEQRERETMLQKFLFEEKPFHRGNLDVTSVIIITEADMCSQSLDHSPFYSQPKKPKAGELYKFAHKFEDGKQYYDRVFIGCLSKSKAWKDRDKMRKDEVGFSDHKATSSLQPNLAETSRKRPRSDSTTS